MLYYIITVAKTDLNLLILSQFFPFDKNQIPARPLLVGFLITCVKKLSLLSRNLLVTSFEGSVSFRCLYI